MTKKTIKITLPPEEDFKKKLKEIVTDLALHTSPTKMVVDAIWNLLLRFNSNEEE